MRKVVSVRWNIYPCGCALNSPRVRILRRVIRGRLRVHPRKLSGNIGPRTHRTTTLSKTGTIIQLSLHLCKHCCASKEQISCYYSWHILKLIIKISLILLKFFVCVPSRMQFINEDCEIIINDVHATVVILRRIEFF